MLGDVLNGHLAAARPRVVAALARSFRDIDLAEDGFQDASVRALKTWDRTGVPRDPVAWLIRTARNATIDKLRRQGRETVLPPEESFLVSDDVEIAIVAAIDDREMRDDVLRLMFFCCHEELSGTDQLALALKVVAGLTTEQIARAFVVRPKTMEQRLTRAKKKAAATVRGLGPLSRAERRDRLESVTRMVYLLFNEGYSQSERELQSRRELCVEAIRLARLLLDLFPSQPELMGLLALCLLQHSRFEARSGQGDQLIELERQDRSLWDTEMIREGAVLVEKALRKGSPGPLQIQAAIAAVHCSAASASTTDWAEIDRLYLALESLTPSPIVTLNRAVAVCEARGEAAALELLATVAEPLEEYRHYHAALGAILERAGRQQQALASFRRALELGPTSAEQTHLRERIRRLETSPSDM